MKIMQRVISLVLMLSMLAGFFPADILGIGTTAQAEAPDPTVVEAKGFSGMPEQAAELADQGAAQTDGGWQYVRIPDTDYAAVVGYTDPMATELEMPDMFGDLDVVAVAPGALSALKQLETIYIPGNVRAMGEKALPRGTSVKAMNAAYAAAWAGENGYPYVNASSYEFREGVVDLSDVRTDNFVRLSESEVWLRNLEATRLKKGSFFFLVDPANAYQISYYKVIAITDMQNGFTCFTCETPAVESILYHYEGHNEVLVPDRDSIILYSGTELQSSGDEVSASSSFSDKSDVSAELHLSLNPEIELSEHTKLEFEIGVTKKYSADFEIGLFTDWSYTIEDEDSTFFKAVLSTTYTDPETEMLQDGAKDFVKETAMTRKALTSGMAKEALKAVRGAHYNEEELDIPMAELMLFSWAGLVNLTGTASFIVELSGEISFTFESTSTTTFHGEKGKQPTKEVKPGVRKITGEAKAELKIGMDVALNLLLGPVKILSATMFIGVKGEMAFALESKTGALGSPGVNEFDLFVTALANIGNDEIYLPADVNLNMLDCITIKLDFVVEVGLKLGVGSLVELAEAKATVVDVTILEGHFHLFTSVYQIEDYPEDMTEWENKDTYTYSRVGEKDRLHFDLDCPYEEKSVVVYSPYRSEKMELYKQYREAPNAYFSMPDSGAVHSERKLLGWYRDASFTNDQFVDKWPIQVRSDLSLYARTVGLHKVNLISSNGIALNYADMSVGSLSADKTGLHTTLAREDWTGKIADGEYLVLPSTRANGDEIVSWVQVKSMTDRTPVATNADELANTTFDGGAEYRVSAKSDKTIYLCAITENDVSAMFFTMVNGHYVNRFTHRSGSFTVPECEDRIQGYDFLGWVDDAGNRVAPGTVIVTDDSTPSQLIYRAEWEANGESTTPESFDNFIGADGMGYSYTTVPNPETVFTYTTSGNAVTITGMNSIYASTYPNLKVPDTIGGKYVTRIAEGAFKDNTSLVAVQVSGNVIEIGSEAFSGCTSLKKIDLLYTGISQIPSRFAYGCSGLRNVTLPGNGQKITAIGTEAFRACTSLDKIRISSNVGSYAFAYCSGLNTVKLNGGVKSIGNYGFAGCIGLTEFTVPDSVNTLGDFFLSGDIAITALAVDAKLSNKTLTGDMMTLGNNSQLQTLVLHGNIETLGDKCLANGTNGFTNLTDLTLPYQLKQVGTEVLSGSAVTNLTLSFATRESLSASGAFRGMPSLENVTVESGTVPSYAFANNTNLRTVTLGAGVPAVQSYAFSGCTGLTTVKIGTLPEGKTDDEDRVSSMTALADGAFRNCTALTTIKLPNTLKTIGAWAFENCTGLTSFTIPDSVTNVGDSFLNGCTNLTYLKIGSGLNESVSTGLGRINYDYKFYIGEGSKLETLELAEGITGIGEYRFSNGYVISGSLHTEGFQNLKTVIFPTTLETIENGNLSAWGQIRLLAFDDSVMSITESGSLPSNLTIYSNSYSSVLADFADSKGIAYVCGQGTPSFKLTCVVPDPNSVTATAIAVSDGALVVASEIPGETVTLPEGYAVLSEQQVAFNMPFVPEAPQVPAGYVFRGWYTDIGLNNPLSLEVMPAADLTLYARIDAPVTIRYLVPLAEGDTQDETVPEGWKLFESYSLQAGESLPVPDENPEIEGYSFRGWYTDAACSQPAAVKTVPTDGAVLYAGFDRLTRIRYAVNLAATGTADESLPNGFYLYKEYSLLPGSGNPVPGDPAPDGYVFEGWFDTPTFTNSYVRNVVLNDDVTYYGKLSRMTAGGRYKAIDGGLQLVSYRPEEDEGSTVHLPARVNGQPVVSIGPKAFIAGGITALYLPETVTSVDPDAFTGSGIYYLYIGRNATAYSTISGVLYNKDATELIYYPSARHNADFSMPDTVERIADRAFYRSTHLENVTLSGALTEIGEEAFYGCVALKSVTLPDSTTTLRENAFYGCSALESFTAYGLTTIEAGTTDDPAETIPRSVQKVYGPIGEGVLRDWFTYSSKDGALFTFQYNQYPLTLILDGETENLTNEAGIPLLDQVWNITFDDGSFVQAWYRDAEMNTVWDFDIDVMPTASLTLYATRTALYTYETGTATVNGEEISGLILTGYNGRSADLIIPTAINGTPVIGIGSTFLGGESTTVTRITVGGNILSVDDTAMSAFTGTIVCDADSPASVWASSQGLNTSLLQYKLNFVSEGQSFDIKLNAKGVAVRLPVPTNSYRNFIGWFMDSACTIAAELDEDGLYIMPGADTTLYAGWDRPVEATPFTWTAENEQVTITGYMGTDTRITIPETINGWPVVAVADDAFAGTEIRSIDTGTVTNIGEGAFQNCSSLEEVTMNQVTVLGDYTFSGCNNLRTLNFGGALQSIGDMAFAGCEALGNITLPDTLAALGRGAFNDCTGLKSLTIGTGLMSFPLNALNGCTRLNAVSVNTQNTALSSLNGVLYNKDATVLLFYPPGKTEASFSVPGGVTEIGESAFQGVTALKQITVPETLTKLDRAAFAGSGLTVFSASGLQTIEQDAFLGCVSLATVNPGENLQSIASGAFAGCRTLTDIYIPETAVLNAADVIFTNNVTITGVMGSSAHNYATAHNILFKDPNAASVTAITLDETDVVLQRGDLVQLTATVTPTDAVLGTDLQWYSSDENVVYVDENGLASAMGGGSATITVLSSNGIRASCEIEVQVAVTSVELEPTELNLLPGETAELTVTLLPASATNKELVWTSSNNAVASVDEDGLVYALTDGTAEITATSESGCMATCQVQVYPIPENILRIPSGTVEIEEEAFQNTAIEYVVIPESTVLIGAGAFAYNDALQIVEFLGGDVQIDDSAFDGCSILRVIAPTDGSVESWANEHNYVFRAK